MNSIMDKRGSENFPVALKAVPTAYRAQLLAIYGFARLVDDIGDEYDGDRLAALNQLEDELKRARTGDASHPVMAQLSPLFDATGVGDEPFLALIEANRVDQRKHRYQTQAELAEYCTLSANPVGRLVLAVFGAATPDRIALSDAVCTGLQLVEHLQDLREDYTGKGRIYLPADEMARFGVGEGELGAARASATLRRLVAHQCDTARGLLCRGERLVASLGGWAKLSVAGYVAGGLAAIDAIAAADHDVLAGLRAPSKARTALYTARLCLAGIHAAAHGRRG